MNLFPGRLNTNNGECNLSIGSSEIPVSQAVIRRSPTLHEHSGEEVVVGIRPEDFSSPEQARATGHSELHVKVARAESLGSELIVYFEPMDGAKPGEEVPLKTHELVAEATDQVAGGTPRLMTARLGREASVRDAGPARLAVDLDRLYFFDAKSGNAIGH
jgi:ABC-type sugar transport system ATPase subunit